MKINKGRKIGEISIKIVIIEEMDR